MCLHSTPQRMLFRGKGIKGNHFIKVCFNFLVIKRNRLNKAHTGGTKAFISTNTAQHNRKLVVVISMGEEVYGLGEELMAQGLKSRDDFVVGYETLIISDREPRKDTKIGSSFDFGVPWLQGYQNKHGIWVRYTVEGDLSHISTANFPEERHLNDRELVDHFEASITEPSYRIYIAQNVYTMPNLTRIKMLQDILERASEKEEYEFCARVKRVINALTKQYEAKGFI